MFPFGQTTYFPPEVIILCDTRNGYCANYDAAPEKTRTL